MRVFQFHLFSNKTAQLKKGLLLITLFFCLFKLSAQETNNLTLRIEPGLLLLPESESLGLLFNVEPNIKISYNTVIGLRFGVALNSQKFEPSDSSQFNIDEESDHAVMSFVPTLDYYLNQNYFRPYLGLGVGFYVLSDIDVSENGSRDVLELNVKNQLGFLLRGGFELGRTKLGWEYNFIPQTDIDIPNGQKIGTVDNSYLGLYIGFTLGGGKSDK